MKIRRQRTRGLSRVGVPTRADPTSHCKVCGEMADLCTCDECIECGYPMDSPEHEEECGDR